MNLFFVFNAVVGHPTSRLDLAERRRGFLPSFVPSKEMLAGAVVSSYDSKDNCIVSDYYHSCDDMSLDGWTEAWMHEVPDSKKLGRMTFPGTHDSAALHNEPGMDFLAKCNSLSITEQLQAGIRYFDIRLKKRGPGMVIPGGVPTGKTLWVWHGVVFQKVSFKQVLDEMANFLDKNPSEGFFMRIYEEGGGGYEKVADFRDLVQLHLQKFLGPERLAPTQGKVTDALTLGQIRGRVVILQDFGGENWVDGAMHYDSMIRESDWNIPNESDLERKKTGIFNQLVKANDNGDGLYFTGFAATGTNFGGPKGVAKRMNSVVKDSARWNNVANEGKPYGFGLLIFDFPGKKLIQDSIKKNYVDFPSSQYKETPCNLIVNQPISNLDRHNVQCGPGQALVEWTMSKDTCTGDDKRILYTCEKASLHLTEQPFDHYTHCSELRENALENLDRQTNIECPNGSVMKGFELKKWHCDGNDMQFRVTCQKLRHAGPVQKHETGCTEIVHKKLEFLDRQRLACPVGTGMSRFMMKGNCPNANDKKFEFTCTNLGSTPYHDTKCNPIVKEKLEWLDRHKVQCPKGHVLTEWAMDKNTCEGDEQAIVYRCEKANLNLIDAPVEIHSGCDKLRGENLEFLDRLDDVYCPAGSAMQGFHLVQGSCSGDEMQLRFTCQKLLNPGKKQVENTGCNDIVKQTLENLDRHRLACPAGTAMHGFRMFKKHCNEDQKFFESVCIELGHTPWHETECDNIVGEKVELLDRHAVLCGAADEVLAEWVLFKGICPEKKMALQYKCEKAKLKGSPVQHFSGCTKLRGEGLEFLDRQNDVKCPAGWSMKGYQLQQGSCTGDDMQYRFTCQELENPGKDVITTTDCQEGGNLELLDRHRPKCNDGFAMAGFEMFTSKCPAGKMKYEVTCREFTN